MERLVKYVLTAFVLVVTVTSVSYAQAFTAGTGIFYYSQYGPLRNKPVRVSYHIPQGDQSAMPVLLVLPGEDRTGTTYLTDWITASEQNRFMAFSLEFSDSLYPGGDAYNLANIFVDGDNPSAATLLPDSVWTFAVLDPIFRYVKQRTNTYANGYVAWGHSAGSQVLHKFVMYKPNSLCVYAICANAGWYTLADSTVTFPYGTRMSPTNRTVLTQAFAKRLTVQLGQADTDPNSAGLRHNSIVDRQGLYRLARGRYFFSNASNRASTWGVPFNWDRVENPGVGHDHAVMAARAVPLVLSGFLLTSIKKSIDDSSTSAFVADGKLNIIQEHLSGALSVQLILLDGRIARTWNVSSDAGQNVSLPLEGISGAPFLLIIKNEAGSPIFKKLIYTAQ